MNDSFDVVEAIMDLRRRLAELEARLERLEASGPAVAPGGKRAPRAVT